MNIKINISRLFPALIVCSLTATTMAQSFTLDMAVAKAAESYPLLRQRRLIRQSEQLSQENLTRQLLPQLAFTVQGSMQSDVTQLNIPNAPFKVEPLSRDQYRAYADLSQIIYDGGQIRAQRSLSATRAGVETERMEVEKHLLKERVQQIYFGILTADAQSRLITITEQDIDAGIRRTEAQVRGGTAFASSLTTLKAERLKTGQRRLELEASRAGMVAALGILTDTLLQADVQLETPAIPASVATERPEIALFKAQSLATEAEKKLISAKTTPRASIFLQTGYGRPGLNMLQNEFAWFGIGGLRLSWQLQPLYLAKREKSMADIKSATVRLQEETFRQSTRTQISQLEAEVKGLASMMQADTSIILLRKSVKDATLAQLEAGVITASDYLREVHAEESARQEAAIRTLKYTQIIHRIHWLKGGQ